MNKNRGSQFRKWDLHLHSLYSQLNNGFGYKKGTQERNYDYFLEKIKKNDIEVVGLTNYFKFEKEDFELKKFLEDNGIITFLNLEIRLSNINKVDDLFDYHIIFNNKVDQQIIENLLGELKANIGTGEKAFNLLNKREIEHTANISFEKLQEILHSNQGLDNQFLTGFLSRGHGSATSDADKKNKAVYENICLNSDFIIHSSCDDPSTCTDKKCKHNNLDKDRNYWLNISTYVKPLLQSSDAHSFDQIGKKFSWIKADKTFEGLKQILFEPKDRICLNKGKPYLEKDELVIDKIVYRDREIYLSENLNSIIGGRATGKSTLLNSIAGKLGNEIAGNSLRIDDFKIIWRDQIENQQRQIEYIPQEYMFRLANDENRLNSLVDKIIKSKNLDEKIEKYKIDCKSIQSEVQTLLYHYSENLESLKNLQRPEAEKDATEKRIVEYKGKRQKILSKNNFTEDEKQKFQDQIKNKNQAEKQKIHATGQKNTLDNLQIQDFKIIDGSAELSDEIKEKLDSFSKVINQEVKNKVDIKISEIITSLDQEIRASNKIIESINKNKVYKKGLEISQTNTELAKVEVLLKSEENTLEELSAYERQKSHLEKEISEKRYEIMDKYNTYESIRESLERKFSIKEIDLEILLKFKQKDLYSEFSYLNGQGTVKDKFIEKLQDDFNAEIKNVFNQKDLKFNSGKTEKDFVNHFFSTHFYDYDFKIVYQNDEFKQMSPGKKAFVILKLILEFSDSKIPVLIDQPEDSLDNRAIYNELTKYIRETKNKRQIIIVTHNPNVVVGSDCENIIVANQHSRNSKNKKDIKFDYVNGSIENSFTAKSDFVLEKQGIREHIFEILEGGKEAFEKREQKYNVKNMRY